MPLACIHQYKLRDSSRPDARFDTAAETCPSG